MGLLLYRLSYPALDGLRLPLALLALLAMRFKNFFAVLPQDPALRRPNSFIVLLSIITPVMVIPRGFEPRTTNKAFATISEPSIS